jgi:hypothetical protein
MDMAKYCYKCERELDYPGTKNTKDQEALGTLECKHSKKKPIARLKKLGTCKACDRDLNIQNPPLKCHGCRKTFCAACEEEFRVLRERDEKPWCKDCFPQYQKLIEKLSLGTYVPK